ncbi:hypothetical protein EK21DRAFT_117903 [Setomelanomma holmii]|uniref:Uncharacterized protein n=1 Tax=Setomelanomma holmii TaxID=210430 RepID=A0A9P4GZH7_9PLEO|nr:hypothetical protein EK21DRAFT_117903 [Setomelanomma holmii]
MQNEDWKVFLEQAVMKVMTEKFDSLMDKVVQSKRGRTSPDVEPQDISEGHSRSSSPVPKRAKLNDSNGQTVTPATMISATLQSKTISRTTPTQDHKPLNYDTMSHPSLGSTLRIFHEATQWEASRESNITPASFGIKPWYGGSELEPNDVVRRRPFGAICKHLKAAALLRRDRFKLNNSHKDGKYRCLFALVSNEPSQWPKEDKDGQYTCKACFYRHKPCIVVTDGDMSVLPLPPGQRKNVDAKHRDSCIFPDALKMPRSCIFRKAEEAA